LDQLLTGRGGRPMPEALEAVHRMRWALAGVVVVLAVYSMAFVLHDVLIVHPAYYRWTLPAHDAMALIGLEANTLAILDGFLGLQAGDRDHASRIQAFLPVAAAMMLAMILTSAATITPQLWPRFDFFRRGAIPGRTRETLALMAALLTTAVVLVLSDRIVDWQTLVEPASDRGWVRAGAFAQLTGVTLLLGWLLWGEMIARYARGVDRIFIMGGAVFVLFTAAGLLLLVAGLVLTRVYGLDDVERGFARTGAYTASLLTYSVFLWSLGPAAVLIFQAERYYKLKLRLCRTCRYELNQSLHDGSTACPECGADLTTMGFEQVAPARPVTPSRRAAPA